MHIALQETVGFFVPTESLSACKLNDIEKISKRKEKSVLKRKTSRIKHRGSCHQIVVKVVLEFGTLKQDTNDNDLHSIKI